MTGNRVKVIHDEIGEVSIACGTRFYGDAERNFVEIAFFDKKDEWYLPVVEPFQEYQETTGETCIYPWVPTESVERWLVEHGSPTDIKSLPFQNTENFITVVSDVMDALRCKERPIK